MHSLSAKGVLLAERKATLKGNLPMKLTFVVTAFLVPGLAATAFYTSQWPSPWTRIGSAREAEERLGGVVPPLKVRTTAPEEPGNTPRVRREPHGHELCASGCTVSHHPTGRLTERDCRRLLEQFQASGLDRTSQALDTLLYYGAQTQRHLDNQSLPGLLDAEHAQLLKHELSRDRVLVAIRLVDQHGTIRAQLQPIAVAQHVRQVFELQVSGWQPIVCSGTIKRVGRKHIWQRL